MMDVGRTSTWLVGAVIAIGGGLPLLRAASGVERGQVAVPPCGAAPVVIRNARVFTGDSVLPSADVWITGTTIKAVGPHLTVPAGTPECDVHGRTLIPGLIDSHIHVQDGADLRGALRFGVTTVLDQFSFLDSVMIPLRRSGLADTAADMADLRTAGTLVTVPGGHGTEYGLPIPTLERAADADAFVAARIAEGSDYIKIVEDDGKEWGFSLPTMDSTLMAATVAAARRHGKLSVVHMGTARAAEQIIASGADGLAHIFADTNAAPGFAQRVKAHGAFVIPTLSAILGLDRTPITVRTSNDWPWLQGVIDSNQLATLVDTVWRPPTKASTRVVFSEVYALNAAGVPLLAGTDSPLPTLPAGIGLHYELRNLRFAGLSAIDALRAATSTPARIFGLHDRGRIAAGNRADMVLIDGDPTDNIFLTLHIVEVWKRGRRVNRTMPRVQTQDSILVWGLRRTLPMIASPCNLTQFNVAPPQSPPWRAIVNRGPNVAPNACASLFLYRATGRPAATYRQGDYVELVSVINATLPGVSGAAQYAPAGGPPAGTLQPATGGVTFDVRANLQQGAQLSVAFVFADSSVSSPVATTIAGTDWQTVTVKLASTGSPPNAQARGWRLITTGPAGARATADIRNVRLF